MCHKQRYYRPIWIINHNPYYTSESCPLYLHCIKKILVVVGHTCPKSPPICMEMIRKWSSSLPHTRNVLASLWYMPRPVGQKRHALAACNTIRKIRQESKLVLQCKTNVLFAILHTTLALQIDIYCCKTNETTNSTLLLYTFFFNSSYWNIFQTKIVDLKDICFMSYSSFLLCILKKINQIWVSRKVWVIMDWS
jgi:hypothetical protein